MFPLRYRLKCTNQSCLREWAFGGTLYALAGGRTSNPPDLIPLDGGIWRNGRVHKVLCDSCSDVIAEHLPPPTQRWPSMHKRKKYVDDYAEVRTEEEEKEEEDGISTDS
jgi:hypothetical protein